MLAYPTLNVLRTLTVFSLQLGNYLEFHLKSNCLPLLTRSRRHSWVFLDMMGCENTKHNIQKILTTTVHCTVLAIYPHDHVAD